MQYSRFRFYIDIYYINEEYGYINIVVRRSKTLKIVTINKELNE